MPKSPKSDYEAKLEYIKLLEQKLYYKENLPHHPDYGFKFYPWQEKFFYSKNKYNLITSANQVGKAVRYNTPIPTPDGFKQIGDLKIGDYVFGSNGKPTRVIDLPWRDREKIYRVTFKDGSSVDVGLNHDWICKTSEERFRKHHPDYGKWVVRSTKQIIESGQYSPEAPRPYNRVSIPFSEPVEYEHKGLFDPYLIGLLIGDGCLCNSITFCNPEPEIQEYVLENFDAVRMKERGIDFRIRGLTPKIKELGLFDKRAWEKRIPEEYLYGSVEERKHLLYGLMDTDGSIHGKGHVTYSTTSPGLRDDLIQLIGSLGGSATYRTRMGRYKKDGEYFHTRENYELKIHIPFCPFSLPRKAERYYKIRYKHERIIYKIEEVGEDLTVCITVDNAEGSFLCTKDHIVTHNSSVQIRKCIHWATTPEIWPDLWERKPTQFWYFYPDYKTATREFKQKWVKEFLPKGDLKKHEQYGWHAEYDDKKNIHAVHFRTGVSVYFMSYEKSAKSLQASSVFAVFADEEMPEHLFSEVNMRIQSKAVLGYFHTVFTATLGQEFWRLAMEEKGEKETFKTALKIQVSMYDCLFYVDGTPSIWTEEDIKRIEDSLPTEAEVQRRVYGRFVVSSGLKYPSFDRKKNIKPKHPIPPNWHIYAGLDVGSGGATGHPSAICFVAVSPDYKRGRVFAGWRGDGITTTAGDVFEKYMAMCRELNVNVTAAYYDWACKDLETIATRNGVPLMPADKSHDKGEHIINLLFKHRMMAIYDDPELNKLILELCSLLKDTAKNKAKDDFTDALRYAVTRVPWVFSYGNPDKEDNFESKNPEITHPRKRHYLGLDREDTGFDDYISELIVEANDLLNDYGYEYDYIS